MEGNYLKLQTASNAKGSERKKYILMAIYALILVNVVQKSKVSIHENDPLSHLNMCTTVIALLTPLVKTL